MSRSFPVAAYERKKSCMHSQMRADRTTAFLIYCSITGIKLKPFANGRISTNSNPRLTPAAIAICFSAFFQSPSQNSIRYRYKSSTGVKMTVCGLIRIPSAKIHTRAGAFFTNIVDIEHDKERKHAVDLPPWEEFKNNRRLMRYNSDRQTASVLFVRFVPNMIDEIARN